MKFFITKFSITNISLKTIFVLLCALCLVLWGTSWKIPVFNIPISYIWLAMIVASLLFYNKSTFDIRDLSILGLIFVFLSIYFFLGIPDNISSDKPYADGSYLLLYFVKFIFGFLLVFSLINILTNENDVLYFFRYCSFFIIFVIAFLAWKYLIVYDLDYIGVVVDDSVRGIKTFKNSLATSLTLIAPFIFVGIYQKNAFKYLSYLGLFAILFFLYWVNSRSAIIILFFELLVLLFLSQSKLVKRGLSYVGLIAISLLIISGISFNEWIKKSGEYSDSGLKMVVSKGLLETHRGWLLIEAVEGTAESSGLGHGMSTFRIRPTNLGSRTETHNDYSLLLYEQGVLGALLFSYLILWRARLALKYSKLYENRLLEASGASLIGLFIALMFVNIIHTSLFWFFIGINFALINFTRKEKLCAELPE